MSSLTGTVLKSDHPLSVVCGSVYSRNAGYWSTFITDVSVQPGTLFIVPNLGNREATGYDVVVIATVNETRVTVGTDVYNINQAESVVLEYPVKQDITVVRCDKNCHLYVIIKNKNDFYQGSMLPVIPVSNMYMSAYLITLQYPRIDAYFVSIVAEGDRPYDVITLDGAPIDDKSWQSRDGYGYLWMEVSEGSHWLRYTGTRFAVYTYGYKAVGTSYGGYGDTILPEI